MAATSLLSAACATLAIISPSSAFITPPALASKHVATASALSVSKDSEIGITRRGLIDDVATATVAIAGASSAWIRPSPAMAYGLGKANDKLSSYGLPGLSNVPNGWSALAEIYGKGANRSPLLVAFGFPLDWVVTLPSQDVNGEDGTIQAGEYAKGDTATFFVVPNQGKVENIHDKDKGFFKSALIAAISQKGSNIYQDFKVTKVEPVITDNVKYMLVNFKYTLLTGAGFEVERTGVASVTSVGDGVQLLWTASIAARYKNKTEGQLKSIVESFRCYADGLNFSADLRPAYDIV